MSIQDAAEKARERQQAERATRRNREAEARPDALHRAIVFLLKAVKENNPDLTEEANHHIGTLDAELANENKVAEIEAPVKPATPASETQAPPDTAAAVKQSKRFKRNQG